MNATDIAQYAVEVARRIAAGRVPEPDELLPIATLEDDQARQLFAGIDVLRQSLAPQGVHLCTIRNVKSGRCTEDCQFCSQGRASTAKIDVHSLLPRSVMRTFLEENSRAPLDRCSLVTAGRRASASEVAIIAEAFASLPELSCHFCASLGLLRHDDLRLLQQAGLTRYHCNLETARSHFGRIVTTHTYDDKLATIAAARDLGLSLCVGGLFGVGETDEQVLELALDLRSMQPQAVPVNFLARIPGNSLAGPIRLSPLRCLRIISLLRFALPRQEIIICGGRAENLGSYHSLLFAAGASGIMTGNYLTTSGCSLQDDVRRVADAGLWARRVGPSR